MKSLPKSLSPFAALALLAGAIPAQQQLVLPDYEYLCKSTTQVGQSGSTQVWRSGGGRFQILYEASHFTGKAGVGGTISIDRLMFRGESGEPNQGGQSWTGVTVELGQTSLTGAGLVTNFGTNRAPAFPDSTIMGPLSTYTVTVLPSDGSTPNNYNIVIDLAAALASFPYNPYSPTRPNLLIDITMPTAATLPVTSGPVMALENTTGGIGIVRGWGVSTAVPNALTGTLATPLVVGVQFSGDPGGYNPPIPARNEFYGAACGGNPSSFYQSFLNGQPFDLGGSSLTLTPDVPPPAKPNFYTVTRGATPINYFAPVTRISTAGNAVVAAVPLGFTFRYPGGPAAGITTINPCTDGYIWLDPTMLGADASPSVGELLGSVGTGTSRLLPLWYDFDCGRNLPTHPWSGLYADTAGPPAAQICTVTWWNVGVTNSVSGAGIGGHAVHDIQCVFHEASGVVEFVYGPGTLVPQFCSSFTQTQNTNPAIVGFTVGKLNGPAAVDPQSRDLSHECPFATQVGELNGNMGQTAVAMLDAGGAAYSGRMFGGQTLWWNVSNVPAGSIIGVQLLDLGASRPGLQVGGITAPGCILSTTGNPTFFWEITVSPGATVNGTVPLTLPHGFEGLDVYAQYVTLDLSAPYLISASSNALKHTIGLD